MNNIPKPFRQLLSQASHLTQIGRLGEATAAIQQALGGAAIAAKAAAPTSTPTGTVWAGEVLDGCVFETTPGSIKASKIDVAPGFHAGSHTHAALTRAFKLFVPSGAPTQPRPLLVMLHGCTQDPDDFAAGTDMNARAQALGFCVLYPAQSQEANPSRCWNWFKHNHQGRGRGEAALIADLAATVLRAEGCGIDPHRVYIAGLSAGGAMAACVAAAFPELFAAVGVHSGLAPGVANNVSEAMAAMAGRGVSRPAAPRLTVPVIVFQGDQDNTVNMRNGDQVIEAARGHSSESAPRIEQGLSAQGQHYTRAIYAAAAQRPAAEYWLLQGAGHAWSGGRAAGSYTDPKGPDASGEMLKFFWAHPKA